MHRHFLFLAGILGFLGVLAGTFGAHGLKGKLEPALLETFEVGVRYHLVHAVALLAVSLMVGRDNPRAIGVAGLAFIVGICIFCGSLYALALTGVKTFGMVAPIGGASFMIGWAALAVAGWKKK